MTKEQVIAIAQKHRQMWDDCTSRPFTTRETEFATLVRNAALEDAAQKAFSWNTAMTDTLAKEIRELKEPT